MKALLLEALRSLRTRPQSMLVAHGGLALALAASLLVALLAQALAAMDPSIAEPERVVVLDFKGNPPGMPSDWFSYSPLYLGPALKARGAPLNDVARTRSDGLTLRLAGGQHEVAGVMLADAEIEPLLGLRAQAGSLAQALRDPKAIAISTHLARRLWGEVRSADLLGRLLPAREQQLQVVAVFEPFSPVHPLFGHELLAGLQSLANRASPDDMNAIFMVNGRVLARLQPGAQTAPLAGAMRAAFYAHPNFGDLPKEWTDGREAAYFRALTLPELALQSSENRLRWRQLAALGVACALLVAMAAINALNLASARLLQRRQETAVRQALGASKAGLLQLWAAEQGLALLLAGALGVLLAWWAEPLLVAILQLPSSLPLFGAQSQPVLAGLGLLLALLLPLTLLAPALLALRTRPAQALQGRTASEGPWGRRLRRALLALQLGAALVLLALTGVLLTQHRHLLQADHGYQLKGRLLMDVMADIGDAPRFVPLVTELTHHPAVSAWAFSNGVPGGGWNSRTEHHRLAATRIDGDRDGGGALLRVTQVTGSFFRTYGMRVLAGDPLQRGEGEVSVVLDAHAARLLGFAKPEQALGQLLLAGGGFAQRGTDPRRVIAVVGDVRLEPGREAAQPQAFVISNDLQPNLTLYGPDLAQLRSAVQQLWQRHNLPFAYRLNDAGEQRRLAYQQEAQLAALLGAVALLAVAVAAAGAYALAADTLRRSRTELVLRRLHGASSAAIVQRVALAFATPLALALLVGLPLATALGLRYRAEFVDLAPAAWGLGLPLILAAVFTVLVLGLAAWRHTRMALAIQPIEALR